MVVEVDVSSTISTLITVTGEEGVPIRVSQCMRMSAEWSKDHQVSHIDNTNTELREEFAKKSGSSDNFECYFHTNTDKDNVWVDAIVGRTELPDRSSSDTMLYIDDTISLFREGVKVEVGYSRGQPLRDSTKLG